MGGGAGFETVELTKYESLSHPCPLLKKLRFQHSKSSPMRTCLGMLGWRRQNQGLAVPSSARGGLGRRNEMERGGEVVPECSDKPGSGVT